MNNPRIKLVVVNENSIGYIDPERPEMVSLLHGSILRGYTGNGWDSLYVKGNIVRLASEQDLIGYRIEPTQYTSRKEEYEFADVAAS